jgi:cytochrome c-type biogenesis protein CcmH/NrfF
VKRAVVACALLALAMLVFAVAAPASEQHPTQGELEAELVCPSCHVPLDESNSDVAQQMKAFIAAHIALGWTKSRIENALAAQLGDGIYGVPRTHGFDLIAWLLPFGGIALGAVVIGGGAWKWSHSGIRPGADPAAGPALDAESEWRVDEELVRFDG